MAEPGAAPPAALAAVLSPGPAGPLAGTAVFFASSLKGGASALAVSAFTGSALAELLAAVLAFVASGDLGAAGLDSAGAAFGWSFVGAMGEGELVCA